MDNILKLLKATIDINIVEAMQHIDANGKGILFIVDSGNKLIGCLSDGDIRRWIIKTGDLNKSIGRIMNVSPKYVENNGRSFALKLLDKYKEIYPYGEQGFVSEKTRKNAQVDFTQLKINRINGYKSPNKKIG